MINSFCAINKFNRNNGFKKFGKLLSSVVFPYGKCPLHCVGIFVRNGMIETCIKSAATCVFQQCGILTSVDSDEPVQPPVKLRNPKWCSVSSLTNIEYSSN